MHAGIKLISIISYLVATHKSNVVAQKNYISNIKKDTSKYDHANSIVILYVYYLHHIAIYVIYVIGLFGCYFCTFHNKPHYTGLANGMTVM